jgi:hypothetical protein
VAFQGQEIRAPFTNHVPHSHMSQPSPIKNIPNDLLEHIISFALENIGPDAPIRCLTENGESRFLTQVIVCLQVSRQFRTVTQHARLWHDFLFSFEDLIPLSNEHTDRRRSGHLCQVLFSDPDFRSCLESKEDWTFKSEQVFQAVAVSNPSFFQNARNLHLCFGTGIESILMQLSTFNRITYFSITEIDGYDLDLTWIAMSLPQLTHLALAVPSDVYGSLHGLFNLQSAGLCGLCWLEYSTLPFTSAETLTRLDLECFCDVTA